MEITIDNIVPSVDYSTPGRPVEMLTVFYSTKSGYKSQLRLPKTEYNSDTIGQKIKEHCGAICQDIGTIIKV